MSLSVAARARSFAINFMAAAVAPAAQSALQLQLLLISNLIYCRRLRAQLFVLFAAELLQSAIIWYRCCERVGVCVCAGYVAYL